MEIMKQTIWKCMRLLEVEVIEVEVEKDLQQVVEQKTGPEPCNWNK